MKSIAKVVWLALFVMAAAAPALHAAVPHLLAWQGVALDSNSVPVTDSTYGFTFRIYDDGISGNLLWQESQLVTTENGVLNVLLGTNNPVPDSVFDGPTCYLEVQFGAEPPYTPRTQIVSVGYAYRTNSVDGAIGGTIAGDVTLKADSSVSGFYLRQQFAPTVAGALTVTNNGGHLNMYDGNGSPTARLETDANDGAGGQFVVWDRPEQTAGFAIYDENFGSPGNSFVMQLLGDSSSADINSNATGNGSVVFSPDAIDASEMFDEPGLASGPQSSGTVTTTQATVASATASFPSSGYVVVICEATFRANAASNYIIGRLYENGGLKSTWWWDPGDVDGFYDQRQTYVYTGSVSAGAKTYTLDLYTSAGTADFTSTKVTVMYFPTSYGTVNTPTLTSQPSVGQQQDVVTTQLDVQAERDASIRMNQKRIADELTAMKERMIRLEAQLKQAAGAESDRR